MSIKIYHGFRLACTSLETAFDLLTGLRPALEAKKRDIIAGLLAHKLCEDRDVRRSHQITGRIAESETPATFSSAFADMKKVARKNSHDGYRDPDTDFGMQVTLFPHGRDVLGMSFTEQDDWHRDLLQITQAKEFNYWNNSDHPEDLTEKDWDCRAHAWKEVMSKDPACRPGFAGLTLNLVSHEPVRVPPERIIAAQPTLASRTDTLARDMLRAEAIKGMNDVPFSQLMALLREADSKIDTPAGQKHLGEIVDTLTDVLPSLYTIADFQKVEKNDGRE